MRNRIMVLFLVLSLVIPFAAHADEAVSTFDKLQGFLDTLDAQCPVSYFVTASGNWYMGTFEDNSYNGYGLWVEQINGDKLGQGTFGFFENGELNGACTTYYSDGSYLSGAYVAGSREGDFVFVSAEGVQYRYTYSGDERVSYEETGTAEPLFIRSFESGEYFGYSAFTADGTRADGHGILCNGQDYIYIGGMNADRQADGQGVLVKIKEDGAHVSTSTWNDNKVVEEQAGSTPEEIPTATPAGN